jgi:hypothetical protein
MLAHVEAYKEVRAKYHRLAQQVQRQSGMDHYAINRDQAPVQILFTELYTHYSTSRWDHFGRPVYVIDPDTFELLANTKLPNLEAKYLQAPVGTFWLQFPPKTYFFGSEIDIIPNLQEIDGVMVSMSDTLPRLGPDGQVRPDRHLTLLVGGKSKKGGSDDNVVFFNEVLDDRPLTDLATMKDDGEGFTAGAEEVCVLTPTAVINLLLYLMQEQPAIQPVQREPRRSFQHIPNERQRKAAESNEQARLAKLSRCNYLYVGRAFRPGEAPAGARGERGGAKLRFSKWVKGHWKFQAYGPHRSLRKLKQIEPYQKGIDKPADPRPTRVQRAQRARPTTSTEEG